MSDKQKLIELAEQCERATGSDTALNFAIHAALNPEKDTAHIKRSQRYLYGEPYTASLDAAMTLVPKGAEWWMPFPNEARISFGNKVFPPLPQRCATPALALCAAALRAKAVAQ